MFAYVLGTLFIAFLMFVFVLGMRFIMGFDRHMREHHNRSVFWKDLW